MLFTIDHSFFGGGCLRPWMPSCLPGRGERRLLTCDGGLVQVGAGGPVGPAVVQQDAAQHPDGGSGRRLHGWRRSQASCQLLLGIRAPMSERRLPRARPHAQHGRTDRGAPPPMRAAVQLRVALDGAGGRAPQETGREKRAGSQLSGGLRGK